MTKTQPQPGELPVSGGRQTPYKKNVLWMETGLHQKGDIWAECEKTGRIFAFQRNGDLWAKEEKGRLCSAVREMRHWGGRVVTGGLRKGGTVGKTGQADSGASFYRAENSHTAQMKQHLGKRVPLGLQQSIHNQLFIWGKIILCPK